MRAAEVCAVLAHLQGRGCRCWVAGGWGVDALAGRQTREHRDLDLAVDARDEPVVLAVLAARGYRIETDQRPVRVELAATGVGWVDVHPVVFDDVGDGIQAGPDGSFFFYPRESLVTGTVAGTVVPCLSAAQQLHFHSGYPPRDVDRADVAVLRQLRQFSSGSSSSS
jgi:lincosamide nucleotidyltransferase A/C/D/E